MLHDVISAQYIQDYKIKITFDDGSEGIADFSPYPQKGGVFSKFNDLDFFKTFTVDKELGVISWGQEIDIAPETLYSMVTGKPLPEWTN